MKPAPGGDVDAVSAALFARALLVRAGAGDLRRDVLIQRSAQGDIDRLRSAANTQHRQIFFQRLLGHFKLELRAARFDLTQLAHRLFAVAAWIDIEVAAGALDG